ncbi:MAG: DUF1573 domain-containing protein [FCB group bacterium]|jgi:hypothetical protein|nr:DUF1573 domain-containing protein [FCB group bacterium]
MVNLCLGAAYGAPKVSLSTNRIDLGTVRQGTITKAVVEVKNVGDQPLQIVEVKTSCLCATTDLPEDPQKRIVAPGAALPLTILYDSKDYVGDRGAYIIIGTNDPEQALSEIELGVNIQALIVTQPEKIVAWGMAPRGEVISKNLTVQPGAVGADIELLDYRMKADTLTATAEKEATKQGSRIKVKFQITPDAPLGALDNELTMRVRIGNEEATIVMPVRGDVVGDVLVMPPAIVCAPKLGYTQGQPLAKDGIIVRASRENLPPPDVLGVICVGPMEAVVHKNVKPDWGTKADRHIIEVRTAPNAPAGAQGGTLFVMTSSKDTPIVTIPVFFRMEPRVTANPANVVLIPSATAPAVQRVELKDATEAMLTVKDLRFESDILDVQIETPTATDADHPATVVIKATAVPPAEKAATIVSIATDQPGGERVLIPVLIRGPVAAPAQ